MSRLRSVHLCTCLAVYLSALPSDFLQSLHQIVRAAAKVIVWDPEFSRDLIVNPLPQPIHGSSFDGESLFVAFHECRKAIDIPLIGNYRRATFSCKHLV